MPAVDERMIPDATIVIVTKNRRDEALRAVASAVSQTAAVEVLVLAGYRTAFPELLPGLPATAPARERVGA